jgi:hypothetical protein
MLTAGTTLSVLIFIRFTSLPLFAGTDRLTVCQWIWFQR